MKIKVFTAFSGYDSQCLALERLKRDFPGFDYELVGWAEIDKYAIQAHNALFPEATDKNYADIDKIQEAGISNSQQYKMAGNSIVVACLYHLFRKMFTEPQNEERQLTFW